MATSTTTSLPESGHRAGIARADVRWPALAAFVLGVGLLFGTSFAQPNALHNAAHDVRHAFAMPCH